MNYRYFVGILLIVISMLLFTTQPSVVASVPIRKPNPRIMVDTGYIELCTVNCSFESGNMSGWPQEGGSFDVTRDFVRSGSYSVKGTSATRANFYRVFSLSQYTTQIASGGGKIRASAFIDPGKSEHGAVDIYFYDAMQNIVGTGWESGWQYSPGTNFLEVANEIAIPTTARSVKVAIYAKRSSGSYTDMNVDDVSTKVRFVYDAGTPTMPPTSTRTPTFTPTPTFTRTPTKTATSAPRISSLSGVVTDATTGQPLSGVTVCITVLNLCGTSDSNGVYTITNIPPGNRTLSATKTGYITYKDSMYLGFNPTTTYNLTISPVLGAGQIRAVLTWNVDPHDLDSHLWTPNGSRIFFYAKGNCLFTPFACLDVDDTSSYGPETITIKQRLPGTYTYAIHTYAGYGSIAQTSNARVKVYIGSQSYVFTPPACTGSLCSTYRWWHVFTINGANGQITPINRYSTISPRNLPFTTK